MIQDRIATLNERVKLFAAFLNAIGLGLIGFAILRPATEGLVLDGIAPWLWGISGLAFHGVAHYGLGYIRKAA